MCDSRAFGKSCSSGVPRIQTALALPAETGSVRPQRSRFGRIPAERDARGDGAVVKRLGVGVLLVAQGPDADQA